MYLKGGSLTDICLLLLAKWHVIGGAEWLSPLHSSMDEVGCVVCFNQGNGRKEGRWKGGG